MNTEVRFIAAIGLMILVLVGTNILFPPIEPEPQTAADSTAVMEPQGTSPLEGAGDSTGASAQDLGGAPTVGGESQVADSAAATPQPAAVPRRQVVVESPIYRHVFENWGAELISAELLRYESLRTANGSVELIPAGTQALGKRIIVGADTLDLSDLGFEVEPAEGITLAEGDAPRTLTFSWSNPGGTVGVRIAYTFDPDSYLVDVQAGVTGLERPLLLTSLGEGMAINEADSAQEAASLAWVANQVNEGIDSNEFQDIEAARLIDGPFHWAAYRSRYFVTALLPGTGDPLQEAFIGGLLVTPVEGETRGRVEASQSLGANGVVNYRLYLGPQIYSDLQALGNGFEEVNPYGWSWLRPLLRPIVGAILWLFTWMHETLNIGYGWVLVVFGVAMRIVLWPLNQKAMRAQFRNMAVQPLVKEIQTKYKDNPEKMQKEMMRLYKEYGFNPLAGCLPMLLPWPVLIALFFVFQNTIELRGVEFLWLPDLAAKDPLYILPIILAVSMFFLQYISFRSMPDSNPQMKTMMWVMPPVFGFIFMQFPAGLNLYYATSQIATLPQQILIANERKKHAGKGPVKLSDEKDGGSGGGRGKKKK